MPTSIAAIVVLLLVAACGAPMPTPEPPGAPADPAAEMRPDLIVADPATAAPGDVVGLRFPEETSRGVLFVLERRAGEGWEHRYNLTSDGPGPDWDMSWRPASDDLAIPDIGVGGPGPDHVPIPEDAEPGEYRICTGNAGDEICTPIEIAAS